MFLDNSIVRASVTSVKAAVLLVLNNGTGDFIVVLWRSIPREGRSGPVVGGRRRVQFND